MHAVVCMPWFAGQPRTKAGRGMLEPCKASPTHPTSPAVPQTLASCDSPSRLTVPGGQVRHAAAPHSWLYVPCPHSCSDAVPTGHLKPASQGQHCRVLRADDDDDGGLGSGNVPSGQGAPSRSINASPSLQLAASELNVRRRAPVASGAMLSLKGVVRSGGETMVLGLL